MSLAEDGITGERLARGVCRGLAALGYAALTEFPLGNGRRADVIAVNGAGETLIVEIKCSVADFRADRKWPAYLEFCDAFYFAVPAGFPLGYARTDYLEIGHLFLTDRQRWRGGAEGTR